MRKPTKQSFVLAPLIFTSMCLVGPSYAQNATIVQSNTLEEIGPWGAAALPAGLRPLPSDLWSGADPSTLAQLFSKIGPDQRFPSLQILVRQAVFSGGLAPTSDREITRARFAAATKLGPAESAMQLLLGVPKLEADRELAYLAIDAAFRAGKTERACDLLQTVPAPESGSEWLESRATCYALNGEGPAANLTADLARGRGLTDTWLARAIAASSATVTAPPPFRADTGRALALSLKANLKPPKSLLTAADAALVSALLASQGFVQSLTPADLAGLTRRAALLGVGSVQAVKALEPAKAEPIVSAAPAAMPPSIAPLPLPLPLPRAALLAETMARSVNAQSRYFDAQMMREELIALVGSEGDTIAPEKLGLLIEASLWNRDFGTARALFALTNQPQDPRLSLVLSIYEQNTADRAAERHLDSAASAVQKRQAVRETLIGWSAGLRAEAGLATLIQTGLPEFRGGSPALRAALELAADRQSKGEIILLAALALQGHDTTSADPETVAVVLRTFRRVGLIDQAKDLSRDYLLGLRMTVPPQVPVQASPLSAPVRATVQSPSPASPTLAPQRSQQQTQQRDLVSDSKPKLPADLPRPRLPAANQAKPIGTAAPNPSPNPAPTQPNLKSGKPSWTTPR